MYRNLLRQLTCEWKTDLNNKRVRYLNNVIDDFWQNEYLAGLRNAHRSPTKSVKKSRGKIGDVLVHDEKHPRNCRRTGRISDLVNSTKSHGQSRGTVVQVTNKKGRVTR